MKSNSLNIFILMDALGWDYIKDRPFLNDLAVTKKPVKSILGFSSGVIPSILSGKYPQEHKHWSLYFYSPRTSPFKWTKAMLWLPRGILNSRIARKIIEEISKRLMGYTGYFETYLIPVEQLHLFDICEKKNIYAPKGISRVSSIFDILRDKKIDYRCFSYPLKDKDILGKTRESIILGEGIFYFLYLSELDALLHSSCKDSEKVNAAIDSYEKEIKELYQIAVSKQKEVNLYVFSDHGMASVYSSVVFKEEIDKLGFKVPNDYVAFYDSTMARFWFFNPMAKTAIINLLKNKNYGRILSKGDLEEFGANFLNNMYGEVIFLMNTGSVIKPSFMGNTTPQGMHGFDVNDGRMDAVLISNVEIKQEVRDVRGFFRLMSQVASHRSQVEKKIKILYFLNSTVRAGVEEHVLELLRHIDKDRFEPILVCPQQLIDLIQEDLDKAQVRYYPVCIHRWRNMSQIMKFLKILKSENPDIVHSHLFFATRFAAPLAKLAGVPKVVETAHLREAWRKGIKKLYFIDRFFYRFVDEIIAVSDAVKKYLVDEKKIEAEKITVIHNGVDLTKFKPAKQGDSPLRAKLGDSPLRGQSPSNEFIIGVIGRLEPQKGHRYFLESVAMLNGKYEGVKFLIVGDGSLRSDLEKKCRELKIEERVEFLGFRKDMVSILDELDLIVLPSLYEGLPLVALEAGAMKKPIIVTNVDGSPEVVINKKTGFIIPIKDSATLKDTIEIFLNNTSLAAEFGENARRHIEENFDIRKQIIKTEELYERLAE